MTQPSGYQLGASSQFKKRFWMTPPNRGYTLNFASMVHIAELYNNYLKQRAERELFPVCDIASQLSPDESVFFDDMHFNESGARRVSELVFGCVEKLGGPQALS